MNLNLKEVKLFMWVIKIGELIKKYFTELISSLYNLPVENIEKVSDVLYSTYEQGNKIFIMGNGGSASLSSHFACDLGKGTLERHYENEKRFRVISLTDNVSTMTAYANDLNYEDIFSQQLKNLLNPKDVLIAISGSGNSKNILKAVEYARSLKTIIIGFTGFDGGKLREMVDYEINVPSKDYGVIEDIHQSLIHSISKNLAEMKKKENTFINNKLYLENSNYVKGIKQAVILAGGLGTRLKPFTDTSPKPMIPINGKPFLEYLINMLKENGIKEVVLLLGYLPEKIQEYFGDGSRFGIDIKYSVGEVYFETGKRIKHAKDFLDENFLLMYADNYWPLNLKEMTEFYNKKSVEAMVTVYNNKDGSAEYGFQNNIVVSEEGAVLKYSKNEKDPSFNVIDIGFFILNKSILNLMPDENFSFEKDILPKLIEKKQLCAFRTDHPYYYVTSEETLNRTKKFLEHKKIVFLDRDGVINKKALSHDYIKNWNEFEFLPGAIEAINLLNKNNYQIYLITNQRGISRGLMTEQDLEIIHNNMQSELSKFNAYIDQIYYCPHGYEDNCDCRKPKPGMLYQAARKNNLDLTKTIVIGDSESDIKVGQTVGAKTFLVTPEKSLLTIVKEIIHNNKS